MNIIVTEWKAFKNPDFNVIKARLKHPGYSMGATCSSLPTWQPWASSITESGVSPVYKSSAQ